MKDVDSTQQSPVILSLCTGSRGLEKGLADAIGCEPTVAAYVEIEAFIVENLVAEMEKGLLAPAPVFTNLKTFDGQPFRNRIHGIVGGYPCQGESNAGKRKLWNDPRFLWPHIEQLIQSTQPVFCFFENVSGHLTGSFKYVLASLRELGYAVEAGIYSASEVVGTQRETVRLDDGSQFEHLVERCLPQQRQRVFILAVKLGNSKLHGFAPIAKSGGHETATRQRQPQEQEATEQSERTDRCQYAESGEGCQCQNGADAQLADSHSERHAHPEPQEHTADRGQHAQRKSATGHREELEHTEGGRSGELPDTTGTGKRHGITGRSTISGREQELADTSGIGSASGVSEQEQRQEGETGKFIHCGTAQGFAVARPGNSQHAWEHPRSYIATARNLKRVRSFLQEHPESLSKREKEALAYYDAARGLPVESVLGGTTHGYNFREDLLRMFGNAVVRQTAEKAYRHLYNKLFNS